MALPVLPRLALPVPPRHLSLPPRPSVSDKGTKILRMEDKGIKSDKGTMLLRMEDNGILKSDKGTNLLRMEDKGISTSSTTKTKIDLKYDIDNIIRDNKELENTISKITKDKDGKNIINMLNDMSKKEDT